MQSNFDDLNKMERRLAGCPTATVGLNSDAMLSAAGRASVRPGPARIVWPVAFTALSLLTTAVTSLWMNERQDRIALASQLRQMLMTANPTSPQKPATASEGYERLSGGMLEVHRALDEGRDPLPAEPVIYLDTSGPSPEPYILRADSLNHMLDQ